VRAAAGPGDTPGTAVRAGLRDSRREAGRAHTTTNYRVAGAGALTDRLLTEYVVQALGESPR
jgi:hypothetical protein